MIKVEHVKVKLRRGRKLMVASSGLALAGLAYTTGAYASALDLARSLVWSGETEPASDRIVVVPGGTGAGSAATRFTAFGASALGAPARGTAAAAAKLPLLRDYLDGVVMSRPVDGDTQVAFLQKVAGILTRSGADTSSGMTSPALSVSPDGRGLVDQDGKPFYWMSDTGWMYLYNLNKRDREDYLAKRKAQGFNVSLLQLMGGGIGTRDRSGHAMFTGGAYGSQILANPDPVFWARARLAIADMSRAGITPAIVLTWGMHVRLGLFNTTTAYDYGRLVARTVGDLNVVFVLGGDINPTPEELPIWNAMAAGIRDSEKFRHLMTFHPNSGGSLQWFADSDWLDFDGMQSGHARFRPRVKAIGGMVLADYKATRVRPVIDLESGYEHIPNGLTMTEPDITKSVPNDKRLDSYDMRVRAYQQYVSGAAGYGYGEFDVMSFWSPSSPIRWPVNDRWRIGMLYEGANQMQTFQSLRQFVGQGTLEPAEDWSELSDQIPDYARTLTACTTWRQRCVVYAVDGDTVRLNLQGYSFSDFKWLDPRTGAVSAASPAADPARPGYVNFTPPVVKSTKIIPIPGGGYERNFNDWVLLMSR